MEEGEDPRLTLFNFRATQLQYEKLLDHRCMKTQLPDMGQKGKVTKASMIILAQSFLQYQMQNYNRGKTTSTGKKQ